MNEEEAHLKAAQERNIEDYFRKELAAYGMAEFGRDGTLTYSGSNYDYLVEIKVHRINKTIHLSEG